MELRTLSRKNTITSLNKKAVLNSNQEFKLKEEQIKSDSHLQKCPFRSHHAFQYIRGTYPNQAEFKKFVVLLYRGLHYGIKNLKGPSQSFIKKKKVRLPQPKSEQKMKKILLMDLDETLIHTQMVQSAKFEDTDVKLVQNGTRFHFNIRPYCRQFLSKMSKIYNVYVFTAGTEQYADVIIRYLNKDIKTISGFLHRQNCMQTNNGYHIKDLRIVQNRDLKDIVIVDNLVHSFGLQIDNGIPILEFTDQEHDKELLGIQSILTQLAQVNDVRDYLREKLNLKKVLHYNEGVYLKIQNFHCA